ncbi:M28 family peptidase [Halostagnicola bangensis]
MNESIQLERVLGRAWHDDRPWELLTELTELPHRMAGSPGERRAAELVGDSFRDAGLEEVRLKAFSMPYWERGETSFTVMEPVERTFDAISLPYSPSGDLEGTLVDVGHGTPEEIDAAGDAVQGAIAVASTTTPPGQRFVHRMEKFGHAVDAGAEAFVFANHVSGQLPPTGALSFDGEVPIPGIGVSNETGDWLREYADRDGSARLEVGATTTDGSSQNVHGVVKPDRKNADGGETEAAETNESTAEILLLAHYDAHDIAEGALDNGCGIATALGAASILSALSADLECRVRVVAVGCEEVGLLGAESLATRTDLESVRAVVNVDGAGRYRNLRAFSHGSESIEELAERVADEFGQPIGHVPEPHPFSDHWPFLRDGVPALQLHSEPPSGSERGRGWGHTEADTRDKVDSRNLREHAMVTALLIRELASARADIPRVGKEVLLSALEEQHYESGMRAANIWPDGWD